MQDERLASDVADDLVIKNATERQRTNVIFESKTEHLLAGFQ